MMIVRRQFFLRTALMALMPVHFALGADALAVRIVPAITDNYILADDQPASHPSSLDINLTVAPDEYEPASFVVYGNEQLQDLRISATELLGADGVPLQDAVVDIRVVKRWLQRNVGGYSRSADPRLRYMTPELLVYDDTLIMVKDGENYLRLASGEYMDISKADKVKNRITPTLEQMPVQDADTLQPLTIMAGSNRQFWVTVYVPPRAAAGTYKGDIRISLGEKVVAELPVSLEVLPFMLTEPQVDYSIFYRGILDKKWPAGSVSSEFKSEQQMLADLKNMRAHGITNPNVYQKFGTGKLAAVLGLRRQAGMISPRLFYLGGEISADNIGLMQKRVKDVQLIAAAYNIDDVYFFSVDEAQDEILLEQLKYWDAVREAGGKVFAAGWMSDGQRLGNFDTTGGAEDMFVCNGTISRPEAERWHGKGKLIYSYHNPAGGRHLPLTFRRNFGLTLWQGGYDGAMLYVWQGSAGNGWNDFDHHRYYDHNMTYPAIDQPIDTMQWEGLREGVDDARYLSTLLAAMETAGKKSPLAAEAGAWLESLKDAPLGQMDLAGVRAEMIAYILALQGSKPADAVLAGIADVRVDPLRADGTAVVRWSTPVRSTSGLKLLDANGRMQSSVSSGALRTEHAFPVTDLRPGQIYRYEISTAGTALAGGAGVIETAQDIVLSNARLSDSGDQWLVAAQLDSTYRASVGINWQDSLLGWWRFSAADVGADLSGHKHAASLAGDAVAGVGWFGPGVSLDGAGSFVNMPDIEIEENGTATIEGWFRFRSFAMDNLQRMGLFSGFYQHPSSNHFYFAKTNDSFESASLLHLGTWHHIALSWDGDVSTARLYIDGQLLMPTTQSAVENIAAINGLNIGRSAGFFGGLVQRATNTFDGDIDEVRVWNRVLSQDEIIASYDAHQSRLQFAFPGTGTKPQWSVIGANAADAVVEE